MGVGAIRKCHQKWPSMSLEYVMITSELHKVEKNDCTSCTMAHQTESLKYVSSAFSGAWLVWLRKHLTTEHLKSLLGEATATLL